MTAGPIRRASISAGALWYLLSRMRRKRQLKYLLPDWLRTIDMVPVLMTAMAVLIYVAYLAGCTYPAWRHL